MDRASILAAQALRLPKQGAILDACAAPGGKCLVLCSRMEDETALVANEFSAERRRRLSAVLDEHLPPRKRQKIKVTGLDAAKMGAKKVRAGILTQYLSMLPVRVNVMYSGSS
jgi:16S rRNA (cytosine1407-C5)-methyltransferase